MTTLQPYMFFFSFPSSEYHSNIFDWWFLVHLLIIIMKQVVSCYFQSILGMIIFHSTFLKVERQEDSFRFSTSVGHVICFHLLKKCESSPCLSVWLRAPPPPSPPPPPPSQPHTPTPIPTHSGGGGWGGGSNEISVCVCVRGWGLPSPWYGKQRLSDPLEIIQFGAVLAHFRPPWVATNDRKWWFSIIIC